MTTSCDFRAPTPVQKILVCYHKERLIGHILEKDGYYQAQSWPNEVLIGNYVRRKDAIAAVADAAELYLLDKTDRKITVERYRGPANADELFDQMWEIIDLHSIKQFSALSRFLRARGFHGDDFVPLIEHAERRYADSPYWSTNEDAALLQSDEGSSF